jgi:hypothetical protein
MITNLTLNVSISIIKWGQNWNKLIKLRNKWFNMTIEHVLVCRYAKINEFWSTLLLELAFVCNWSTWCWLLIHNQWIIGFNQSLIEFFVTTLWIRDLRIYFHEYWVWVTWLDKFWIITHHKWAKFMSQYN